MLVNNLSDKIITNFLPHIASLRADKKLFSLILLLLDQKSQSPSNNSLRSATSKIPTAINNPNPRKYRIYNPIKLR